MNSTSTASENKQSRDTAYWTRKAFLIAAFVFVQNYVLGTVVVLQLNLANPNIGGPAKEQLVSDWPKLRIV